MSRLPLGRLQARAPQLLAALPIVLALVLVALWVRPNGSLRSVQWQAPEPLRPDLSRPGSGAVLDGMRPPSASQYASIMERPLFSTTRRPPPPKPVEKAAVPAPAPDALETTRIYGTFVAAGASGIIADIAGKPRRVLIGGMVGDWKVGSIADRDITFVRGAETRVIKLLRAKPGVQGAAAFEQGGARPATMQWGNGRTGPPP